MHTVTGWSGSRALTGILPVAPGQQMSDSLSVSMERGQEDHVPWQHVEGMGAAVYIGGGFWPRRHGFLVLPRETAANTDATPLTGHSWTT